MPYDPSIARAVDAGLLAARVPRCLAHAIAQHPPFPRSASTPVRASPRSAAGRQIQGAGMNTDELIEHVTNDMIAAIENGADT